MRFYSHGKSNAVAVKVWLCLDLILLHKEEKNILSVVKEAFFS